MTYRCVLARIDRKILPTGHFEKTALKIPAQKSLVIFRNSLIFKLVLNLLSKMERFERQILALLSKSLKRPIDPKELEIPPEPSLGDFGFPCFRLAKEQKKNPTQIANDLRDELQKSLPKTIEIFSQGAYLNFKIQAETTFTEILKDILEGENLGHYGSLAPASRGVWVLEYSSPNIMKAFNIYHLRTTALGAALDRIGKFRGFKVTSINHLGDWGTQFGKLVIAFDQYAKDLPAHPTVHDLVEIYVKFHKAAETDPTLEDRARAAFKKLEEGDSKITALWKKCVDIASADFDRLYQKFNVKFDYTWGESFYKNLLTPLLDSLKKKGILVESEGAWIVPLTDEQGKELTPCILQKKDGATIYATRDVAAAIYRYEKFHFERMSYLVGADQKLHFQQIFGVLKKMGHSWGALCEHIPTGIYRFKDAKMSTRKGNFVTLEEVLTLTQSKVRELMENRTHSFTANELEEISEKIAVGALLFFDLHTDPTKDVEFDVERVVDFEGETGPYLQYAHTRCQSILRKAKESGELKAPICFHPELISLLKAPEEINLVKILGRFPLHLERALEFSKASQLAHYLIDLTRVYGAFYRECHVLGQAEKLTQARLMLVESTRRILTHGLSLLGIPLPERM